jgi:DHA1 family inner membrane transport protein
LGRWPVLLPMLISTMASVSMFSLFTYITPLLEEVTGLTPHGVTGALLAIGVGLTIGNLIGGRLADRNLLSTIIGAFICLVIVLGALALVVHMTLPTLVLLILWGGIAFALVSPLQIWVVDAATDAPNLASTLNQGAFNLGNATGAWIGGVALNAGVHYAQLPLLAALVAMVGLGLTLSSLIDRRILPAQISPAE